MPGRMLILGLVCLLQLAGCVATIGTQVVGAAVGAAMQSAGLTPPDPNQPRPLALTLAAGELLNATASGESLSLVVRLYQLRNDTGFSMLSYSQAGDAAQEAAVFSDDLVAVRELILIPGKVYQLDEPVPADVDVIGVVALFRAPAENRWKLAFDRSASEESGISVGFHGCAMTVGKGDLTSTAATAASRTLGGIRCH